MLIVYVAQEEDGCWEYWIELPNGKTTLGEDGLMSREIAKEKALAAVHDEAPR